jgi:hypothetical protein
MGVKIRILSWNHIMEPTRSKKWEMKRSHIYMRARRPTFSTQPLGCVLFNTTFMFCTSLLFLLPPPSPLFLRVGWPLLYTYSLSLHYIIWLPSFTYKGVSFFLIVSYFWEGVTVSGGMGLPLVKGVCSGDTCAHLSSRPGGAAPGHHRSWVSPW